MAKKRVSNSLNGRRRAKKRTPEAQKARLMLRAELLKAKDVKDRAVVREKTIRSQLRST